MDKNFLDSIVQEDFVSLRDMLKNRLLMDHDVNGGMFREYWTECDNAGLIQSIFQEHDGRELSDEITESNYNILVGQLATNFSEKRLNKILSLAKQIWPTEQSTPNKAQTDVTSSSVDSNMRVMGEERVVDVRIVNERIIGEREIPHEDSQKSSERMNTSSNKNDSNLGVVVAVVAVAVVAVIAGVVIFG